VSNNVSRSTSWAEPLPKPEGPFCGARQPVWPSFDCNRPPGHVGKHCRTKQCGDRVVDTWWDSTKEVLQVDLVTSRLHGVNLEKEERT
jgi:hypothetical protein